MEGTKIVGGDYHIAHNPVSEDEPPSPNNEDHYQQPHIYTGKGELTVIERYRHEVAHHAGWGPTNARDGEAVEIANTCR